MNVDELRSFEVLASHLHYGRAAQALHLSQPALTKQMHRLEEALGGKLFERGKHGTRLTVFGERFLPKAKELTESVDQLQAEARRETQGRGGRLRIGFGYNTLELVPRWIVKLRRLEPDIEISLRDMSSHEQIAALQNRQLDVGFIRLPLPATRELESFTVLTGYLALVQTQQAAKRARLTLDDCRNEPFVILTKDRSPGLYDLVLKLCARHGFHPRVVQEVSELTTALALVRAGMGLSILPESSWSKRFGGVRIQPIRENAAAWSVAAVWRKRDENAALGRFLEMVRAEVRGKFANSLGCQQKAA